MKTFGILNITPDSFSDGGEYEDYPARALEMMEQGAYAIDIGAESTRPNATPLTPDEEWQRLKPVLESLWDTPLNPPYEGGGSLVPPPHRGRSFIPLSIDTRNPETARRVVQYNNVRYLNDVSGFADPQMVEIAAENNLKLIAMHSLTVPADKDVVIEGDATQEIINWSKAKLKSLKSLGIPPENVIIDPGIGFGKTAKQSMQIIAEIDKITKITHDQGARILVGHSRKSFLGLFGDKSANNRDLETAMITDYLRKADVDFVRVHNVQANNQRTTLGGAIS